MNGNIMNCIWYDKNNKKRQCHYSIPTFDMNKDVDNQIKKISFLMKKNVDSVPTYVKEVYFSPAYNDMCKAPFTPYNKLPQKVANQCKKADRIIQKFQRSFGTKYPVTFAHDYSVIENRRTSSK